MKKIFKLISFILFIFIFACKDKDKPEEFPSPFDLAKHWGSVNYLMNGKNSDTTGLVSKRNFTKIAALYSDTTWAIEIARFTDDPQHLSNEIISFGEFKYPPQKGIYKIGGTINNLKSPIDSIRKLVFTQYMVMDHDVILGNYFFDNTKTNSIEITDYNSTTQEIKGKFNVTYTTPYARLPPSLSLTQGVFHTKFFKF
jgi:hypothetical protein